MISKFRQVMPKEITRIFGNSSVVFLIKLSDSALIFVLQMLLVRSLGVDDYGLYAAIISWMTVFLNPIRFGLGTLIQKEAPKYIESESCSLITGLMKHCSQVSNIFIAAMIVLGLLYISWVLELPEIDKYACFVGCLLLLFQTKVWINHFWLQVYGNSIQSSFVAYLLPTSLFIIAVFIAHSLMKEMAAVHALLCCLFAWIVACVLSQKFIHMRSSISDRYNKDVKAWNKVAVVFGLTSCLQFISIKADILMLSLLDDISAVGLYSVVSQLAGVIGFAALCIYFVVIPHISSLYESAKYDRLQNMLRFAVASSAGIGALIFIILFIGSSTLLSLFSPTYASGELSLKILALGQLINLCIGHANCYIMMMNGYHNFIVMITALSTVINIALNYILIPEMGVEGASLATFISLMIWNLLLLYKSRKTLQVDGSIFSVVSMILIKIRR